MNPTRRLALVACLSLLPLAPAGAAEVTGGPMVGATSDTAATVWVRTDGPAEVLVRVRRDGDDEVTPRGFEARTRADRDHTATVTIPGCEPDTVYHYAVHVDGRLAEGKGGSFRTMPRAGTGKVTLAFGSCVNMSRQPEQSIFDAIAAARPTAFLFLGDNSYFTRDDTKQPATMWARVREQRQNPSLARLLAGTPIFAQWDDHDYGPNDSDETFELKGVARDIFMAYWPMPAYGEGGQGIYARCSLGPVDVFMLDDRTFRSPNRLPDGPEKGILGERQRVWLLEALAASQAPIKVVATASQFLARYHAFESWNRARFEREWLLDGIQAKKVTGVVFISGDRHLAEALRWPAERVGYTLWEVTSSPLANSSFVRGALVPNEDRAYVYGDGNNFGWLEVDLEARKVTLELRDSQGKTLWSVMPDDLLAERKPRRRTF